MVPATTTGFQSFNKKSLKDAQVDHAPKVEKFKDIVRRLHDRWIVVSGFFVFGFDGDRAGTFDTTVKAIKNIRVDDAGMFIAGVRYVYDSLKWHFIRRLAWALRTQVPVVLKAPQLARVLIAGTLRPHQIKSEHTNMD